MRWKYGRKRKPLIPDAGCIPHLCHKDATKIIYFLQYIITQYRQKLAQYRHNIIFFAKIAFYRHLRTQYSLRHPVFANAVTAHTAQVRKLYVSHM
jgi:hypothetical protein